MSLTRRLAAGLPAVGVSALAALAFAGAPAYATGDTADRVGQPAVAATPCADSRTKCDGYGYDDETPPTAGPDDETPTAGPDDDGSDNGGAGADNGGADDDDRGNPGYGGESPATTPPTTPPTTPTGITDTVPPGGVSPATSPATPGGGVSAGGTLPVTGAPMGATIAVGALLVAGGSAAVWYTRRRRSA
jgi:LPXTG-motif cell wall-anchored protein